MILPSRSRMWTDCPSDCSTLGYCLSGSPELVPASPAPVARPSRCSGDECGNDADPRAHARGPLSNLPYSRLPGGVHFAGGGGGGTGAPRRGETDCERRRSPTPGMSLDISCLSCACPTSSSRIFFRSSSPVDSIHAGAVTTDADSPLNRPNRRHHRPHRAP
uniref:Uncharacterized protein n=1 Tax=Arundo donax TaxID=35708 RepID=A0A0A9CV72_ARUDO